MVMEPYNPPQDPWLVILYQDEHIMVVNKPSGLLSVPGRLDEHKDSVMTRIQRERLNVNSNASSVSVNRRSSMSHASGAIPRRRKGWWICH